MGWCYTSAAISWKIVEGIIITHRQIKIKLFEFQYYVYCNITSYDRSNYLCLDVEENVTDGETEDNESLLIPVTGSTMELLPVWWLPVTDPFGLSDWLRELFVDPSPAFHPDLGPVTSSDILKFKIYCFKNVKCTCRKYVVSCFCKLKVIL